MRHTISLAILAVLVSACSSGARVESADPPIVEGAGGTRGEPSTGVATSSGHGAGASGTTSTGSGWSTGTPTCMFGVTGDVVAWVGDGEGWLWSGESLECMGTVLGVDHMFGGNIGAFHGPGTYALSYVSYTRSICDGEGCSLHQGFVPGPGEDSGCTVEVTSGPDTPMVDATVSGTFYCGSLVDGASAVTLYNGSFNATIQPAPQ